MTDIVDRLRTHVGTGPLDNNNCVKCAAAEEILQLRARIQNLQAELARLHHLERSIR